MLRKALKGIAIALGIFLVMQIPAFIIQCFPGTIAWLYEPVKYDSISQREHDRIEEQFGINIPETAKFIQNFHFPSRDPTDIYIFEFDASNKGKNETFDAYFRRIVSIDDKQYGATWVSDKSTIFYKDIEKVGLVYTSVLSTLKADFKEIHYKVTGNNTIEAAFIIG